MASLISINTGKVVVIGGSAGAIPSIIEIARGLPQDFPAPILIVVHISPQSQSVLPLLLANAGPLRASHAVHGETMRPGHIYVAPPDHQLMVIGTELNVNRGARENHHRPAIDPLFRSAAATYGMNVIAVLLSGYLDDGTVGLLAVKRRGGIVLVQDPQDTPYPDMPRNALENVRVDHVLPLRSMTSKIVQLLTEPAHPVPHDEDADELKREMKMTELAENDPALPVMPGKLSTFVCPECQGSLWEIEDQKLLRFRCHVGHAYSPLTLEAKQNDTLEAALWSAVRALDEKRILAARLAERARIASQPLAITRFEAQRKLASEHAATLRRVLLEGQVGDAEGQ